METKKLEQLILQVENYLECWKQFNYFLNLARARKFETEDETQFLETKSVLTQELEMILAAVEFPSPSKDEIHTLLGNAASLRAVSELSDPAVRNLESSWHKIFISLQSNLGQLKVKQREVENQGFWGRLFGRKKSA
jgi:HPt (histidine-containing phosphotransfer) domain-containing protein